MAEGVGNPVGHDGVQSMRSKSRWLLDLAWWIIVVQGTYGGLTLCGYWGGYGESTWNNWSAVGPAMSPGTATMFVIGAVLTLILHHFLDRHFSRPCSNGSLQKMSSP